MTYNRRHNFFTCGSKMMTSGTPRPASFVKMSKKVDLFTTTPSDCRPGPLAVTLLGSPACPSTLTIYGLFGISLPAKSTFTLCGPSIFGVYETEYVKFLSLLNLISTLKMQSNRHHRNMGVRTVFVQLIYRANARTFRQYVIITTHK